MDLWHRSSFAMVLYQIVFTRFSDDAQDAEIQELHRRQRGLAAIDGIEWVRAGLELDPDGSSEFTHCALIAIRDRASRDRCPADPLYREVEDMLEALAADRSVIQACGPEAARAIDGAGRIGVSLPWQS